MDFLVTHQTMIIGIIFMLVLGPAVGNYACSVVYRLPLGKTPFERHPFCGHCNADLKSKDLFPILSWLSTKGKCRYCRGPVPGIYTLIEVACGAVFIAYFLHFGMGEAFLLYAGFAVFTIILAAIEYQQGWISSSIYGYAITCGVLARTVAEGTIHGWVKSFVIALTVALVIEKLHKIIIGRPFSFFNTHWLWWYCLIATSLPLTLTQGVILLVLLPLSILFKRNAVAAAALIAIVLPVLILPSPI